MPSPTHQILLLLFRCHPALVFELARRAGVPLADAYERSEEVTPEFDNPLAARKTVAADLALAAMVDGVPHRGLVIEVQLGVDLDKEWTVVLYRAGLRHRLRCPAWAIIVSPDPKVRAAFHERMFLVEPELRPLVVTPEMFQVAPHLAAAIADYPAAVLTAVMHATGPDAVFAATLAIRALIHLAPPEYGRYIQLVSASVGKQAMGKVREQLAPEDRWELSEWERRGASFVMGLEEGREQGLEAGREQGLEAGREQGLEEGREQGLEAGREQGLEAGREQGLEAGREQGLEQGLLHGLRSALRTVLASRGLTLDGPMQGRIDGCFESEQLREWITRATTVTAVTELLDPR